MASKYDERLKAQVIADRALLGSYRAVARRYGISCHTVKRWCDADAEMAQKCAQKKDEVTADILDYIKGLSPKLCGVLDLVVQAMTDPDKLKKAKLSELATVYGILADKGIAIHKTNGPEPDTDADMAALADLINHPQPNRDIAEFEGDNE